MPVVNVRTHRCDVYCGRSNNPLNAKMHFGNPFSHINNSNYPLIVKVASREEAVVAFEAWLFEEAYLDHEPERRKWIQDNVHTLKGKILGCYCKPQACHCDILERIAQDA